MTDGKLRFYDKKKETLTIDGSSWGKIQTHKMKLEIKEMTEDYTMEPYPDEMFEEAERREKLNAGFKQDADGNWYRPTLQELTRNERIELAEKEIAYIVMGGQDGREYANSIAFILQVLDSLRDD